MTDHNQTEEEIRQEMEELGISNESEGSPNVMMSGPVIQVIAVLLIVLLAAGALFLVF